MKIIVADTGSLISLGLVDQIYLIEKVFGELYIANAVQCWCSGRKGLQHVDVLHLFWSWLIVMAAGLVFVLVKVGFPTHDQDHFTKPAALTKNHDHIYSPLAYFSQGNS
jgi:hypothetical protein